MKCDEAKPFCARCLSGRRVCEGYGVFIQLPQARAKTTALGQHTLNIRPLLISTPESTLHDPRILAPSQQIFLANLGSHSGTVSPMLRSASFWRNVVLPACHQEPPVLHAVLALLHAGRRCSTISDHTEHASSYPPHDQLQMLIQYNHAIHSLKLDASKGDKQSIRVVLITCILFMSIELRIGRTAQALKHLDGGRQLLLSLGMSQDRSDEGERDAPRIALRGDRASVDEELVAVFADLDIQATYFGSQKPQWSLVSFNTSAKQPKVAAINYTGLPNFWEEAHRQLTVLINRSLRLLGSQLDQKTHTRSNQITNSYRDNLIADLRDWQHQYSDYCYASVNQDSRTTSEKWPFALMLIHHAWLTILLSVSYWEIPETAYDSFTAHFRAIVDLASILLADQETPTHPFSLDFGLILPLWTTAMKCRDPLLRRTALRLLMRTGNEGFWDADLVALLAEETIKIEEGINMIGTSDGLAEVVRLEELIPLEFRVSNVEVDPDPEDSTLVIATFLRVKWDEDGSHIGRERLRRKLKRPGEEWI